MKNLAIAYSVKRKSKKMAHGGPVSAKSESRPMPDSAGQEEVSRNSGDKAPHNDRATDMPERKQASRGMKTTSIKQPRHVPINGASLRLRDEETDLEMSATPAPSSEQPPQADDEMGADRQGRSPHKMKMMAKGGPVSQEDSEYDAEEHPADLESDDDMMGDEHSMNDHMQMLAEGGDVSEEEVEHAASIAAAIMAKRRKMMAEGGQVNLASNADEEPNHEDEESFDALKKENYSESEGLDDLDSPMDSNEHHDEREAKSENEHDDRLVSAIRRKMKARSAITR